MSSYIDLRLTGGASNSDPDASLGGTTSSESLSGTALNNLFADLTGIGMHYRAIAIKNTGDIKARHVEVYFDNTTSLYTQLALWYDSTGTQSIANETTEPTGASGNWETPTEGVGYELTDLDPAGEHRIWIRRTVLIGAPDITPDSATIGVWFN